MQERYGFIFSEDCLKAINISAITSVHRGYCLGCYNLDINGIQMTTSLLTDDEIKDLIQNIVDIVRFESNSNHKISDLINQIKERRDKE